jgi:hypothetical protein
MVNQEDFLKEIIQLKNLNPTFEIHFLSCIDGCDEDFSQVGGQIVSIKLGFWHRVGDFISTESNQIEDEFWSNRDYPEVDEVGAKLLLSNIIKDAKRAIVINIAG